jgi:adenylylsulfate kinase
MDVGSARAIWIFGRSAAGKTSLAHRLKHQFRSERHPAHVLDGDAVRARLNRDLGFSDQDRSENIRRIAEVARLFLEAGVTPICAAITPRRTQRDEVRAILGDRVTLVYAAASLATCTRRDPKGLYERGIAYAFEEPASDEPVLIVDTDTVSLDASFMNLSAALDVP